jgi:hypothetical protein
MCILRHATFLCDLVLNPHQNYKWVLLHLHDQYCHHTTFIYISLIYFLKTKLLSKLSIYKKLSGPTKWSGPTILQAYVLLILIKGFQSPLRKLIKGDALSPLVSEKSTKALLLYLKTLFYLIMA